MTGRFGSRGIIAVLIPVQNSNRQPEKEMIRPEAINDPIPGFGKLLLETEIVE